MQISLNLDTSACVRNLDKLKTRAPVAQARAMNRAIGSARTVVTRLVAADMGLKASDVRAKLEIREATPARLVATLFASPKRLGVIAFGAKGPTPSRGRGRGVTARTRARRYPHAWIGQVGGHTAVLERKGRARLPIHELFNVSIAHVADKKMPEGQARAIEAYQTNIQHEMRFALEIEG